MNGRLSVADLDDCKLRNFRTAILNHDYKLNKDALSDTWLLLLLRLWVPAANTKRFLDSLEVLMLGPGEALFGDTCIK